jgi:hypothetical protein
LKGLIAKLIFVVCTIELMAPYITKPNITTFSMVRSKAGQRLNCSAIGEPAPKYQWKKYEEVAYKKCPK